MDHEEQRSTITIEGPTSQPVSSTWTGQENKMATKMMGHLPTTKMEWTGLSTYSHNYTVKISNYGRPECAAEAAFMDGSISVYYPEGAVRGTIGTL